MLTNAEEAALVNWLTRFEVTGYPHYNTIQEMAEEVKNQCFKITN